VETRAEEERIKKCTLGIFVLASPHSKPVFTVNRLSETV